MLFSSGLRLSFFTVKTFQTKKLIKETEDSEPRHGVTHLPVEAQL